MFNNQESDRKLSISFLLSKIIRNSFSVFAAINFLLFIMTLSMVGYKFGRYGDGGFYLEILIFALLFLAVSSTVIILILQDKRSQADIIKKVLINYLDHYYSNVFVFNHDGDILFKTCSDNKLHFGSYYNIKDAIASIGLDDFSRNKLLQHIKLQSDMSCYLRFKDGVSYFFFLQFSKVGQQKLFLLAISPSNYITFQDIANNLNIPLLILDENNRIVNLHEEVASHYDLGLKASDVCRDISLFKNNFVLFNLFGDVEQDEEYLMLCPKLLDPQILIDELMSMARDPECIIDRNLEILQFNNIFTTVFGDKNPLSFISKEQYNNLLSILGNDTINNIPTIEFNIDDKYYAMNIYQFKNKALKIRDYFLVVFSKNESINIDSSVVHSQKLQAIGQLAGGIAHDFNNLITAILGFCDLLLIRHNPSDLSFPEIMQIKQNANRAANLVRQLLAFSRKQTLQPVVIDITEVLDDLIDLISRLIGDNLKLEIYHGRDLWFTKVDVSQFEQVIINLVVNARDAMDSVGKLSITTENVVISDNNKLSDNFIPPSNEERIHNGEYVRISVKDTGCGITPEDIPKIFEPFYSTKEIGSGTGLGLATVYGIIRQTNGYIYVSSEINKGTEFHIYLHRYIPEKDDNEESKLITAASNIGQDLTGSAKILLVEDEDAVRAFVNQALSSKGYIVVEASTGYQAKEILENNGKEFDLIISDVMIPGMNGPQVIKEASAIYPNLKVIFVSGYGEDAFSETFGMGDRKFNFLAKPFTLKELAEKVKVVLQNN